ncbi:hypothetical protein B484DRAFT_212042 [Ochromonadaceae sp. CCMP2298]|nr:hypothetical protein B484DRAFT_212042 [Ochromonadaceae sp. CCMP2298]
MWFTMAHALVLALFANLLACSFSFHTRIAPCKSSASFGIRRLNSRFRVGDITQCSLSKATPASASTSSASALRMSQGAAQEDGLGQYFVPAFVAFWAVGYSAIFLSQMSYRMGGEGVGGVGVGGWEAQTQGLGESGGVLGVGLTVVLFVVLVGYAGYEVLKPGPLGSEAEDPWK